MGKVLAGMAMSLDGFIEDRNGSVARLYPDFDAMRQTELLQEEIRRTGAVVMGRRAYDMAQGDFTGYEFQVPIFVLTHAAPATVARGENDQLRFTLPVAGKMCSSGSPGSCPGMPCPPDFQRYQRSDWPLRRLRRCRDPRHPSLRQAL